MTGLGLILAAPASGSGKTLITAGLARHLRGRGLQIAAAKAGPDFIDPTFHAAATGRACINLDVWGMRPATLEALVAGLETTADIVLCEGAMGLFDGTGSNGETGSTAELAGIIGWPVVLVVDARGQGASVAALLRGFAGHQLQTPIAGVFQSRIERPPRCPSRRRGSSAFAKFMLRRSPAFGPGAGPPRSSSRPHTGGGDRGGRHDHRPLHYPNRRRSRYRPAVGAGMQIEDSQRRSGRGPDLAPGPANGNSAGPSILLRVSRFARGLAPSRC